MLVDGSDFVIRVVPLPATVNGFVTYDEEARANIYINENIDEEKQKHTALHELRHVWLNDAFRDGNIRSVEG